MMEQRKSKQYEKPSTSFSNKATVISFIMAVFVVSIHAGNLKYYGLEDAVSSLAFQEEKIIAEVIGRLAVPFFFMLSGYWFFRMDISAPSVWDNVKKKNIKKLKTLVLPYLLWNAFSTVFYMTITRIPVLANEMNNGEIIPITLKTIGGGYCFMSSTSRFGIYRI